jgi:hypothetical protein
LGGDPYCPSFEKQMKLPCDYADWLLIYTDALPTKSVRIGNHHVRRLMAEPKLPQHMRLRRRWDNKALSDQQLMAMDRYGGFVYSIIHLRILLTVHQLDWNQYDGEQQFGGVRQGGLQWGPEAALFGYHGVPVLLLDARARPPGISRSRFGWIQNSPT